MPLLLYSLQISILLIYRLNPSLYPSQVWKVIKSSRQQFPRPAWLNLITFSLPRRHQLYRKSYKTPITELANDIHEVRGCRCEVSVKLNLSLSTARRLPWSKDASRLHLNAAYPWTTWCPIRRSSFYHNVGMGSTSLASPSASGSRQRVLFVVKNSLIYYQVITCAYVTR